MKYIYAICFACFICAVFAENPDGKIGVFKQRDSVDCFFLASLIAVVQDSNGSTIANSLIHKTTNHGEWRVNFPSHPENTILVTKDELSKYKLTDMVRNRTAELVEGDDDVKILEIAADKIWLDQDIKPEGLWDDIPMNSFFMFSKNNQLLLWNRDKASSVAIQDVDKYKRLPPGTVKETQAKSVKSAKKTLMAIVKGDTDGLSMVLLDYHLYHGFAITDIDFDKNTYLYINPALGSDKVIKGDLSMLLQEIVNGNYAINYMEIK